ncbi:MAG: hypothetical protein KGQ41_03090 [Alphaproteobacteria bacterium]|nr:hypothetical protein [Alphaproteobacteria bacterium]
MQTAQLRFSESGVPLVAVGHAYKQAMRRIRFKPDEVVLCSNDGNAAMFHDVMLEDAASADLCTRFNNFGLYKKPLLAAFERDAGFKARVVFQQAATDAPKLDAAFQPFIQAGRLEVFTFDGEGNLEDMLYVRSRDGFVNLRLQTYPKEGTPVSGLGIWRAIKNGHHYEDYFSRMMELVKPLAPSCH